MPIDSAADLLFRVGANTDDAEANIARFRTLFTTSFDKIGDDFSDWAEKTFGKLNSVASIGTAGAAALAAGLVAAGGAALEATHSYEKYVEEVEHGARVTNIGVETMSGLHLAAQITGTSFDTLTRGIAFFERQVSLANQGGEQQLRIFQQLGISQAQIAAGEKDIMPLLETVAKHWRDLGSGVEKTTIARELFSRSGVEDQKALALLADGIQKLIDRAAQLGIKLSKDDVEAMERHQAASQLMKAEWQALAVFVGRELAPSLETLTMWLLAVGEAAVHPRKAFGLFRGEVSENLQRIRKEIDETVAAMGKFDQMGDGGASGGGSAEKIRDQWAGISEILKRVNDELAGFGGEEAKAQSKIDDLVAEISKARGELEGKQKAGSLAPGVFDTEMASLERLYQAMPRLYDELMNQIRQRRTRAASDAESDLRQAIEREQDQTRALQEQEANEEADRKRDSIRGNVNLTDEARLADLALVDEWLAARLKKLRAGWKSEDDVTAQRQHDEEARQEEAYEGELGRLNKQLEQMTLAHLQGAEKIKFQAQMEREQWSEAAEAEAAATAGPEAERASIHALYAAIRKQIDTDEQKELDGLKKTWSDVFGANGIAGMLKAQKELLAEHQKASQQWAGMMKATFKEVGDMGEHAFDQLAQGMGQNIAHAMIYGGSIGKAMKESLAATLESIAAQSMVQAIYATALGFLDLALGDYDAAGQAFTAAAIFGSVGAAAAIAGRAIVGPQGGSGGAGGGPGAGSGAGAGGGPGVGQYGADTWAREQNAGAMFQPGGTAAGMGGVHVTVNVQGHVIGTSGVDQLCGMISDAVVNRGVTLTAKNTTTGVQITR